MRVFFDTSVFVPLFLGEHAHHRASRTVLDLKGKRGFCAAHSLAELYSTLTRMPPPNRVSPDQAIHFVEEITSELDLISLDADEYVRTLSELAAAQIAGGAVYDGLLAHCALKTKADIIYTWNVRHFQLFGPEIAKRIRVPTE